MSARTLLLLTQTFPPFGGAASRRVTKMVKHLAPLGWRTVVVTSPRVLRNVRDDALLDDVPPSTAVLRTPSFEPLRADGAHGRGLLGLRRALNVPLVPSVAMMWAAPAFAQAFAACRRWDVDVVLSSGPDFSSHVLAAALRSAAALPTVLDYRDEWTTHFDRQERIQRRPSLRAKNAVDRELEKLCLRAADRVILNTPAFRPLFVSALGCDPNKLVVLPNGYDVDEIERHRSPPQEGARSFTLVHVGSVDRDSQIHAAFFALLRERAARHGRQIQLRFVGSVAPELAERLDDESFGALRVTRVGFLPARKALAELEAADAALLLQESSPGSERYQNLKLFDYLGARIPILAIAPDPGEIARVIRECDAGAVADSSRIAELGPTLDDWLAHGAHVEPDEGALGEYAWPSLAERLAMVLEESIAARRPRAVVDA